MSSSIRPSTHQLSLTALALHPVTSSLTDARPLPLNARNADKVPRPGDSSPVQLVEMMVHKAHEINVAVRLVDAPAFAHKAEIDASCRPLAICAFVQDIDTLEGFLVPRYAQLRLCMPPHDAFLLLMVTILELFALCVLRSLRSLRGSLPSLRLNGSGRRLTG